MGEFHRELPGDHLGWIRALVQQQGQALARLAAERGRRGAEGFACVEQCIHDFLALSQAQPLSVQPDDARQILTLLLGSIVRMLPDASAPPGPTTPPDAGAPAAPDEDAEALLESAGRKARALVGSPLLPRVQRQAATLLLLGERCEVAEALGLAPAERQRRRRQALSELRRALSELAALEERGAVLALDDASFEQQIRRGVTLVHFVAGWCKPCQAIAPHLEALAIDSPAPLRLGVLDVEHSPETTARYRVRALPTLLLFRDGQLLDRLVGATSEERLRSWVGGCLT